MREILVILIVAVGCHKEPESAVVAHAPTPSVLASPVVARGAYVARLAGCNVCHVKGGGMMSAPNITADPETGLGRWTESEIIAAVRQGLRPDGGHLGPTMPYVYFHAMTDDDAHALVAFLRTLPPVQFEVAHPEHVESPVMLLPPERNLDPVDDPVGHGQYLAALMHCGACHTPQGGSAAGHLFAGGTMFGTIVAPNITPDRDTGLGTWSVDDIARVVARMTTPSGIELRPPMTYYRDNWSKLTDQDLRSVAMYVASVPAVHHTFDETAKEVSRTP